MLENSENRKKLKELKIFEKVPFEFKDGWTDLVYELGKNIEELCELTNYELPMIQQIKEKMGTLRFYYDDSKFQYPDAIKNSIFALVSRAVLKSANICETCGKWGELRVNSGYWFVSCDEHKRNSITAEEWKELDKKQREDLENEEINKKPYKPLKFEDIKSAILKRKIMEKVACFEAVCWDYEINAVDVFNILRTKDDKDFPISYDVLRKKVLKYVSVDNLKKVFTDEQLIELFADISLTTIRNSDTKIFIKELKKA
ncbi:hypothetical protein [Aliarcobacter butzleri]|uniref:hypothetical protein n=1 Tax=Aliarcobacter butzleri TaxID=28197 RepID=UPI0021B1B04C|nr:hypothetical protein [Aliarcobacter butzleri]MCT7562036.1 hypothetical protein [Aliarcobacter butzleri]